MTDVYRYIEEGGIDQPFISPFDVLVALNFLKVYNTEYPSAHFFDISTHTYQSKRDAALVALYFRLPDVRLYSLNLINDI